jgi:histone H3/H4
MSGYMLFLKDFRSSRPDSDSKVPVGEFAKLAGAAWKELDEQTRAEYQSKAKLLKQEKANVEQDNSAKLLFPLANVKRIAKLDPEVKNISKDALLMIAKATECFVETCAQRTSAIARSNNKKTIELAYLCNFLIFEKR